MRIEPSAKYRGMPCSYVGTGCAYEDVTGDPFLASLPAELKDDGYLTLDSMNRFVRKYLPIRKKVYYRRTDRPRLSQFLSQNTGRAAVCVLGHFIYVNGEDYWSFFNNENGPVVCVWYIKD